MESLCINETYEVPCVETDLPTVIQDCAGNLLELDLNGKMKVPPNQVPQENCMICRKKVRVLGSTHNKCRRLMDKLYRAKQKVLETEFQLFCLKYAVGDDINIDAICIDD